MITTNISALHIARALTMARMGHEPEARFYLRRLALSLFRHYRSEGAHNRTATPSFLAQQAETLDAATAYMLAARRFRGGPIALADVDLTDGVCESVRNPHWPGLGEHVFHGVFVQVHAYLGSKPAESLVEVQICSPDAARTQFCPTHRFESRGEAEVWARKMVTVGRAVVAATVEMNRPVKRSPAVRQELALEGAR